MIAREGGESEGGREKQRVCVALSHHFHRFIENDTEIASVCCSVVQCVAVCITNDTEITSTLGSKS